VSPARYFQWTVPITSGEGNLFYYRFFVVSWKTREPVTEMVQINKCAQKHEARIIHQQQASGTNADHVTPHEQGEMLSRHQAMFHAFMHMFRRAGNAGRIIVRGKRKKNFAMP
jgi:hypothetical protein